MMARLRKNLSPEIEVGVIVRQGRGNIAIQLIYLPFTAWQDCQQTISR